MNYHVGTLCRSQSPRGASLVLTGAMHCLGDCALTLTLALKRAQPEETLLKVRYTETR